MIGMPDSNTAELLRFEDFRAKHDAHYEQSKSEWADAFAKDPAELVDYIDPVEERDLLVAVLGAYVPGDLLEFGANVSQEIDELIERVAARLANKEVDGE